MSDIAIKVDDISKDFRLPHEKVDSVKNMFVNSLRYIKKQRTYEMQHALKGISFEVNHGEFFGIVGRNGSGKSTLLKMMAGIYQPNHGKITVNGKLVPFIELGVGFSPELTGRENVYLNGALLGFSDKEIDDQYDDIVNFAELHDFMDQKLKNYSSGMQVRLAFSIAIRARSDILLIDEVLAVGDAAFQQKCFDYFRKLKREKKTVIFISHDMGSVREYCDRSALINDGVIEYIGETDEVASRYLMLMAQANEVSQASDQIEFLGVKMSKSPERYKKHQKIGFTINYKLHQDCQYDIGISIQKKGVSIYERNTKDVKLPSKAGTHELFWEADDNILTEGIYKINVAAFTKPEFELMAFDNEAASFYIEHTKSKGGLIDMSSGWKVADGHASNKSH
jgi:ABC-2 type transport system ATP-binding protein